MIFLEWDEGKDEERGIAGVAAAHSTSQGIKTDVSPYISEIKKLEKYNQDFLAKRN